MAKKRTKADKLQLNVEQLARRDEAYREKSAITDQGSEAAIPVPEHIQLEERIRLRAYDLYEARGRKHGCDLGDWLKAVAEILAAQGKAAA